jgi:hypothetical protein
MKSIVITLLIISMAFTVLYQTQDGQAQHGDDGMTFQIIVSNHDIEITQLDENRLHVHEIISYVNPGNESYTGKITCWALAGSSVTEFEPFINDTYLGGNHTQLSPVIYQYNLADNGLEIGPNETLQFIFEYDLIFEKDAFMFEKAFYYSNYFIVVSVYPIIDVELTTANFQLEYNAEGKYYVTHDNTLRSLGDAIAINFSPAGEEESSSDSILPFVAVIVLIGVVIVAQQVYSRNIDLQEALKITAKNRGSGSNRSRSGNSRTGGSKGAGSNHAKGSRDHTGPKRDFDSKIPITESMDELLEKKAKLLKAIKRLDDDHRDGLLSDDIHSELKADYKQKAIDVLKMIDGMK